MGGDWQQDWVCVWYKGIQHLGKFRYAIAARAVALAVKKSLSEHNKKPKIKLQQQELTEMEHDEFLQAIRSPFHFATCDAVLRGCKIVDISKPLQWRRLSKKVRSPLGPSARGLRPQAVGERTVRLPEIFRAMARFSPAAPSGHRSPSGASPTSPLSGGAVSQREGFRQPEPLQRQGIYRQGM